MAIEQAVQLLNQAKLCSDAREKVDCLKGLLELVVNKEPDLIQDFLPEVLELQVDPAPGVRKALPDWLDGATRVLPSVHVLLGALQCLARLLNDSVPTVAKRAMLSSYPTYRAALALVAVRGSEPPLLAELQQLWQAAQALKQGVVALAAAAGGNPGVRLAAIKVVEQTIMLLTADVVPAVAGVLQAPRLLPADNEVISKAVLVRDADQLLSQVMAVLKASSGEEMVGPVTITCIKAAVSIAQQRTQFIGRIIPSLLSLASSGKFKVGAGSSNAHSDVATTLQGALSAVYDLQHPIAAAWKKKVADGLSALGVAGVDAVSKLASERQLPDEHVEKRARVEPSSTRQPTGEPILQQQPSLVRQELAPGAPGTASSAVTGAEAVVQVHAAVCEAVSAQDVPSLATLLLTLQPAVMADLALQYLCNLPPRSLLPPDSAPHEPWVEQLMAAILYQPGSLAAASAQGREQARAWLAGQRHEQHPALTPTDSQQHVAKQPQAQLALQLVPPVTHMPVALTEQTAAAARRAAVLRMLITPNTSARAVRAALVARLAATSSAQDRIVDGILEYLFEDFHGRHGLEVSIAWLYALFTEQYDVTLQPGNPADGDNGREAVSEPAAEQLAQLAPNSVGAQSAGDTSNAAEGNYEDVLLSLLQQLRDKLPVSDRTLVTLLLSAPSLPMPSVRHFLEEMRSAGPEWATLTLLAARDLVIQRPCSRAGILPVVLNAAVAADGDVRTKAVRLIANQLFAEPALTATIYTFAQEQLATLAQASERTADLQQQESLRAKSGTHNAAATGSEVPAADEEAGPSEVEASRVCALYCALCTKQPALLLRLFDVYAATSPGGQAAIHHHAAGLAKTLGTASPALLAVVQDPPPGSLPLVLQMLYVLTETAMPPPPLVAACLQLYSGCKDARVLPPALPGMQRSVVLRLLPALLDLPADTFRAAVQRLVTVPAGSELPPLFTAPEVLAALHAVDSQGNQASSLRKAMTGITACINSRELFSPEALAATINQLLTRVPLPQLFMRTVIQSLAAAPKLRPFVVGVLKQLAGRQIWSDATQWRGWVMCAQQTAPESFPALLQLPAQVLAQTLQSSSAQLRTELAAYAASPQCQVVMQTATREVLGMP